MDVRWGLLVSIVAACDDGGSTDEPAEFDAEAVAVRAADYADALVQVNAVARASAHGLAAAVNVYVTPDDRAAYLSLDPGREADVAPTFAADALLVKEHLDSKGDVAGLTIMAAGDPSSPNGWWWARADAELAVVESGQLGYCISCHDQVEAQGWVFGVPLDNRR